MRTRVGRPRASEVGGRICALGTRLDTAALYDAADIYVDSYPVTSITSLLEAGSRGVPLVSRFPYSDDARVLGSDTPGLAGNLLEVRSGPEYEAVLAELIEDDAFRSEIGEATRRGITAVHQGRGWGTYLEALYLRVSRVRPGVHGSTLYEAGDAYTDVRSLPPALTQLDLMLPELFAGEPDLDQIREYHMRLMPAGMRWHDWNEFRRARNSLSPGLLLSEWLGTQLERLRLPLIRRAQEGM